MEILKGEIYHDKINDMIGEYMDFFIKYPEKKESEALWLMYGNLAVTQRESRIFTDPISLFKYDMILMTAKRLLKEEQEKESD